MSICNLFTETKSKLAPQKPEPPKPAPPKLAPIFINDEYLRYWKMIDEDVTSKPNTGIYKDIPTYKDNRQYFIDTKNGYPKFIKDIDLSKLPDISNTSDPSQIINFISLFLEEMFNKISIKQYLKGPTNFDKVVRPNHGGLNHFRSFLFSAYIVFIFIEKNISNFNKYITNNKIELIFLLLASYFQSLLRIDESANRVPFFNKTPANINIFEKIFVNISKNQSIKDYFTNGSMEIYMTTLASSFLFMSICNYLKKINKTIDDNLSNLFIEKIGLGLCMYEHNTVTLNTKDDNLKPIFLIYGLVSLGHYADHCRVYNFSDILEQEHIKTLLGTIGIKPVSTNIYYMNIIKYIILLISHTEYNTDPNFDTLITKDNAYWETIIKDKKISKNICKFFKYNYMNRFENRNFIPYSMNFNTMYTGIKTALDTFINFENNISAILSNISLSISVGGNRKNNNKTYKKQNNKKKKNNIKTKTHKKKKNNTKKNLIKK